MPDLYIGGNVTMRITDEGANVSFWILTDARTFNHQQRWSWSDSGVLTFDMNARGSWQLVARVWIPNSRNVSWTIYSSGLGFPTSTITMWVNRATIPPAPYFIDVHATGNTTIHAQFVGTGDGGSPIREWQLAYGGDPNGAWWYIGSGGVNDVAGLVPGTSYYFWARGRNDLGWGYWSARASATTWRVPYAPTVVTLSNIMQNSLHASFREINNGGQPVTNWQLGYGQDPNTPTTILDNVNSGEIDLTDLDPGKVYYFWARGVNSMGLGDWSQVTQAQLIAGATISVGGVVRRAVPYVKDAGVWQLARPWSKAGDIWRSTSS